MSSSLQLDVRNLSLQMCHLVNAYEVKAGIGVIAGNTVGSLCALSVRYYKKCTTYNTLTFNFKPNL